MKTVLMILMAVMFGNVAYAGSVQFWLTANTPAKATEVNQNFTYLTNNAAFAGMRSVKTTTAGGVGLATCASNEFAVGGGCNCTGGSHIAAVARQGLKLSQYHDRLP